MKVDESSGEKIRARSLEGSVTWRQVTWASALVLATAAGLGSGGCFNADEPVPPDPVGSGGQGGAGVGGGGGTAPTTALSRPSKSGAIAISDDDALVAMVNPGDDSLSVFRTDDNTRLAKVATGDEPTSVVIHPDGVTAFVANRADATVVKVSAIDSGDPVVSAPLAVGSEPTGVALSPTGQLLFVAELAEGRVSVVDTASMDVVATIDGPDHPRALAVTNDGDLDDDDERLIVPEFFGQAVAGGESKDDGRSGMVRSYALSDFSAGPAITFQPLDSGFGSPSVTTSPNQLYAVAIAGDRIFVPSVSASPEAPVSFNTNVQPVVYVGDLATNGEDTSNVGTANLAALVRDTIPSTDTRFFLADIVDVAMVGDEIAYVLSRGSNVVQRVHYNAATGIEIGSAFNKQIDVGPAPAGAPDGCAVPIGIVTNHAGDRAYLNCWVSRRLGVIDLTLQEQVTTVEAFNPPTTPEAIAKNRGLEFFHTGRARWSSDAWSDCASCHPDGLTDNVTWSFAAGPRQTTSLDGAFSKGPGPQEQRVFNWTAIFDELHDFERNTRGVSGGLGAITQSTDCGNLAAETPSALPGPPTGLLGTPVREIQNSQADNCTTDWDDIETWVRTVRPPRALRSNSADDVAAGAQLFQQGGCDKCHSGAGWTVSRVFWSPSTANNSALTSTAFPASSLPAGFPASWNAHTTEIGVEPSTGIAPAQVACAIRNVGSFGIPGDAGGSAALEKKATGATAQGAMGFNVPSLYGLALGAPYLHHGQATSLDDLLSNPKWSDHLQAGNPVFVPTPEQVTQLVAFLTSIDAASDEMTTPAGFDVCRPSFP